jgi:hypothetical protein
LVVSLFQDVFSHWNPPRLRRPDARLFVISLRPNPLMTLSAFFLLTFRFSLLPLSI